MNKKYFVRVGFLLAAMVIVLCSCTMLEGEGGKSEAKESVYRNPVDRLVFIQEQELNLGKQEVVIKMDKVYGDEAYQLSVLNDKDKTTIAMGYKKSLFKALVGDLLEFTFDRKPESVELFEVEGERKAQVSLLNGDGFRYLVQAMHGETKTYELVAYWPDQCRSYTFRIGPEEVADIDTSINKSDEKEMTKGSGLNEEELEEVQPYFSHDVENASWKEFTYYWPYVIDDELITLAAKDAYPFIYNKLTGIASPNMTIRHRWQEMEIEEQDYMRDSHGYLNMDHKQYVLFNESDGYNRFSSIDAYTGGKDLSILGDDLYIDQNNVVKNKSRLDEALMFKEEADIDRLDYNDEWVAIKYKYSDELNFINRITYESYQLDGIYGFFHVVDEGVVYNKGGENCGLYYFTGEQEKQLLNFAVLDGIIYEGELYYLDINYQIYHLGSDGAEQLTKSPVIEYIFDDQMVIVCVEGDLTHVLYKMINKKLEFVRQLTLKGVECFDWFFSDGQRFYYKEKDSFEAFSTSMDLGQITGEILYEDNQVRIMNFYRYGWEHATSVVEVYDKIHNTYENIGKEVDLVNYYKEDNKYIFITGNDQTGKSFIYSYDLDKHNIEEVYYLEKEKSQDVILDLDEENDVIVYRNNSNPFQSQDGSNIYVDIEGNIDSIIQVMENGCYYQTYDDEICFFDYPSKTATIIDIMDSQHASEFHHEIGRTFIMYQANDHLIKKLDFETGSVLELADNCRDLKGWPLNGTYYYIGTDEHLYGIRDDVSVDISKEAVVDSDGYYKLSYYKNGYIADLGEEIYFINLLTNQLMTYNFLTDKVELFETQEFVGDLRGVLNQVVMNQEILWVMCESGKDGSYVWFLIEMR